LLKRHFLPIFIKFGHDFFCIDIAFTCHKLEFNLD
jgi:hypothetical protein